MKPKRTGRVRRSDAWRLSGMFAGPAVWAAHFAAVYLSQSTLCSLGASDQSNSWPWTINAVVLVETAVALLAMVVAFRLLPQGRANPEDFARFAYGVAVALLALSIIGTTWVGLTALLLAPCTNPSPDGMAFFALP